MVSDESGPVRGELQPNARVMTSPDQVRLFILAGNAVFTLTSLASGDHYTFRVSQAKDEHGTPQERWFAEVETGYRDFRYLGMVDQATGVRRTKATRYSDDAGCMKALRWFLRAALGGHLPDKVEVRHEGRCGRCGRELTEPTSIDRGIGPDCWERMGGS